MSAPSLEGVAGQAYELPRNTQFSIFLENRVGKLLELVETFDSQALRVVALNVMDAADYAVARVLTSRQELARRLLIRAGLPFSEIDVLVVGLGSDHTLTKLCKCLLQAELNVHYAYPLLIQPHGQAAVALYTDDQTMAGQVLRRKMFVLLGENDLGDNATPGSAGLPGLPLA
jgi:hypothetical protein